LLDFGADCVYGSQAHQVQKIEFYKNKPIFHGLGSFLFDQIHRIGVKQGYFLEHYLYKGRIIQSKLIYTMISEGRRPEIANPEDAKVIKEIVFDDELVYR
jgi:poly-gamma-glutamate capsule biosynthesis protein CapA/YwtB (metallophosphatase superfamily)